jgi:hypothetical protein
MDGDGVQDDPNKRDLDSASNHAENILVRVCVLLACSCGLTTSVWCSDFRPVSLVYAVAEPDLKPSKLLLLELRSLDNR